ncbi:MAG: aspartate-semialdehyde dehydrogenase [Mariprofundales bacterium]
MMDSGMREALLPPKPDGYRVAVVGATGAVGKVMLEILAERKFPISAIIALASARSVGKFVEFGDEEIAVDDLAEFDPYGWDIAIFSAGGNTSLEYAPRFAEAGCFVIDNSSAWRMHDDVPLVVPEVNLTALEQARYSRIIANPNCSTIQMVVALKPLHDVAPIRRLVISTYQAVSGGGNRAIDELATQSINMLSGKDVQVDIMPARIAFNIVPHIDVFMDDGYTKEEHKLMQETCKIMQANIAVTATAVRVPVFYAHAESINATFDGNMTAELARNILANAPGCAVVDDPSGEDYPMPMEAAGTDAVWIGRIRDDLSYANTLNLWIVADNVRKGAALNAVQIAESLIH